MTASFVQICLNVRTLCISNCHVNYIDDIFGKFLILIAFFFYQIVKSDRSYQIEMIENQS